MGDASVEVTEENRDAAQEAKMQAVEAISEGVTHSVKICEVIPLVFSNSV